MRNARILRLPSSCIQALFTACICLMFLLGILSANASAGIYNIKLSNSGTSTLLSPSPSSPPGFDKAFSPATIAVGGTSTLTFTIDNTGNTVDATSLDFTDNLPTGVTVADPANASTTCIGGTLTAAAGSGSISYSGGTIGAGSTGTITVNVTSSTEDTYNNTSGDLTSSLGNSGTASDTLTVNPGIPGAPTALPATLVTEESFSANWNTSANASGYRLDVATDNGFTSFVTGFDNRAVGDVTTFPVTGLSGATEYFYRVRAENISGVSGNSNTVSTPQNNLAIPTLNEWGLILLGLFLTGMAFRALRRQGLRKEFPI